MRITATIGVTFAAFAATSAIATLAHAQTYTVCIGEKEHNCPRAYNSYYGCEGKTKEIEIAQQLCTIHMPDGEKKISPVRNVRIFSIAGDACGYVITEVTCVDD